MVRKLQLFSKHIIAENAPPLARLGVFVFRAVAGPLTGCVGSAPFFLSTTEVVTTGNTMFSEVVFFERVQAKAARLSPKERLALAALLERAAADLRDSALHALLHPEFPPQDFPHLN
jgi:hypothetical protein